MVSPGACYRHIGADPILHDPGPPYTLRNVAPRQTPQRILANSPSNCRSMPAVWTAQTAIRSRPSLPVPE